MKFRAINPKIRIIRFIFEKIEKEIKLAIKKVRKLRRTFSKIKNSKKRGKNQI